ncbi:membrane protein, putative [hydrothermal vent metagenome]|uniref:Membrane protein, putative n=1 Tax=hydrothermal vent metagenome TaxID=652676 RepID=A0A1W1CVI9_9ZZZZ
MKKTLIFLFFIAQFTYADVVKPALIELSIYSNNSFELEMSVSIEAAISGISTKYKNTKNAPNAKQYDDLRALQPSKLKEYFKKYEPTFLKNFSLKFKQGSKLKLKSIHIPIVGYKKIPRISKLIYQGELQRPPTSFTWKYAEQYGDNAFRYRLVEKNKYTWQPWEWLKNGKSKKVQINITQKQSLFEHIIKFISIGFQHILPKGLDHILFIIGIALLGVSWRKLLLMVSTYTIAHTITLGLSIYEIIALSPRIVEPLIAISIVYVAIENLWLKVNEKLSILIVFLFGLLHGLGFATMLSTFEMAKDKFLTTLLSFNIGVELGQIVIIISVLTLRYIYKKANINFNKFFTKPVALLIAIIGVIWTIERIFYG